MHSQIEVARATVLRIAQPFLHVCESYTDLPGQLTRHRSGGKLPKIRLLSFDGVLKNWQLFWEKFEEVVHQNNELSQGDKFNNSSSVTGKGVAAIAGLAPTVSSYDDALDILG